MSWRASKRRRIPREQKEQKASVTREAITAKYGVPADRYFMYKDLPHDQREAAQQNIMELSKTHKVPMYLLAPAFGVSLSGVWKWQNKFKAQEAEYEEMPSKSTRKSGRQKKTKKFDSEEDLQVEASNEGGDGQDHNHINEREEEIEAEEDGGGGGYHLAIFANGEKHAEDHQQHDPSEDLSDPQDDHPISSNNWTSTDSLQIADSLESALTFPELMPSTIIAALRSWPRLLYHLRDEECFVIHYEAVDNTQNTTWKKVTSKGEQMKLVEWESKYHHTYLRQIISGATVTKLSIVTDLHVPVAIAESFVAANFPLSLIEKSLSVESYLPNHKQRLFLSLTIVPALLSGCGLLAQPPHIDESISMIAVTQVCGTERSSTLVHRWNLQHSFELRDFHEIASHSSNDTNEFSASPYVWSSSEDSFLAVMGLNRGASFQVQNTFTVFLPAGKPYSLKMAVLEEPQNTDERIRNATESLRASEQLLESITTNRTENLEELFEQSEKLYHDSPTSTLLTRSHFLGASIPTVRRNLELFEESALVQKSKSLPPFSDHKTALWLCLEKYLQETDSGNSQSLPLLESHLRGAFMFLQRLMQHEESLFSDPRVHLLPSVQEDGEIEEENTESDEGEEGSSVQSAKKRKRLKISGQAKLQTSQSSLTVSSGSESPASVLSSQLHPLQIASIKKISESTTTTSDIPKCSLCKCELWNSFLTKGASTDAFCFECALSPEFGQKTNRTIAMDCFVRFGRAEELSRKLRLTKAMLTRRVVVNSEESSMTIYAGGKSVQ